MAGRRLRVVENGVLKRISGRMTDEVKSSMKKIHTEKLHNLYLSPSIVMVIKLRKKTWVGHAARKGEVRKSRKKLTRPFGRFRCHIKVIF